MLRSSAAHPALFSLEKLNTRRAAPALNTSLKYFLAQTLLKAAAAVLLLGTGKSSSSSHEKQHTKYRETGRNRVLEKFFSHAKLLAGEVLALISRVVILAPSSLVHLHRFILDQWLNFGVPDSLWISSTLQIPVYACIQEAFPSSETKQLRDLPCSVEVLHLMLWGSSCSQCSVIPTSPLSAEVNLW